MHKIEMVAPNKLKPRPDNRNKHPDDQIDRLVKVIEYQGFRRPIIVSNQSGQIVCGHGRLLAAKRLKLKQVPVIYQDYTSPEQEYADHVADNAIAEWADLDLSAINTDLASLGEDFDIELLGLKDFTVAAEEPELPEVKSMREKFIEPPFSVLSARGEGWQNRKREWIAMGIQSELGRGGGAASERVASFKSQDKLNALRHSGRNAPESKADVRQDEE